MPRSLLVLAGGALIVAALYFARAILLPIALAESGDRPPDLRAERSDRALHDLVACAVVFFQPQCVHGSPSRSRQEDQEAADEQHEVEPRPVEAGRQLHVEERDEELDGEEQAEPAPGDAEQEQGAVAMPLLILPEPATIASSLSKRREQKTCWRPSRERAGRRVGAELAVSIRIRSR